MDNFTLTFDCPACQGTGWDRFCDCDPDSHYSCRGQGSCGMQECPHCENWGNQVIPATGETLAQAFHESYEKLAPEFSYKTRKDSAVPWADVPDSNKKLMIATATRILQMMGIPGWRKISTGPPETRGPDKS